MKHIHHDLIVAWAADPSLVVQSRRLDHHGWAVDFYPQWLPYWQYRFKPAEPKFIVVNGIQVPEPVRCGLEYECTYWVASIAEGEPVAWIRAKTLGDTSMHRWLRLGLIHLTREAAQAHIDAMLLPSRTDK